MNKSIKLIELPEFRKLSPDVVRICDKIRFELGKKDDTDEYGEFCWFAREYPRCYRYHLDCAEYRLQTIYDRYKKVKDEFEKRIDEQDDSYGFAVSSKEVITIYWDFESFLSSINSALDILARVVGVAYPEQTPPSFNKICKKEYNGLVDILRLAQKNWVSQMKDYRDCFIHYTPVDTQLLIAAEFYKDRWEIRCKLPINPNVRDIHGFKYSRRVELLKYSISTYKHMVALDKSIAREIKRLYKKNEFPKRKKSLFFLGIRSK